MGTNKLILLAVVAGSSFVGTGQALAQMTVIDPSVLGQAYKQVQQGMQQLQQLQKQLQTLQNTYNTLSHPPSNILRQLGTQLSSQQYRNPIGVNSGSVGSIMNGTGSGGALAQSYQSQNQVYAPTGQDFNSQEMARKQQSVAGVMAMAAALYQSAQNHVAKLNDLESQLLTAGNDVTAVAQINAQINLEVAALQGQQLQAQALNMWQEAQTRSEGERASENTRKEIETAIAAAGNGNGVVAPSTSTTTSGGILAQASW